MSTWPPISRTLAPRVAQTLRVNRPCATPGCAHWVAEAWEATGLFCPSCSIEKELYDRPARWARLFSNANSRRGLRNDEC